MTMKLKRLQHGMLLDAKSVMDDAMPELMQILDFIPECLHQEFGKIIKQFEDTLCTADVSDRYEETT